MKTGLRANVSSKPRQKINKLNNDIYFYLANLYKVKDLIVFYYNGIKIMKDL